MWPIDPDGRGAAGAEWFYDQWAGCRTLFPRWRGSGTTRRCSAALRSLLAQVEAMPRRLHRARQRNVVTTGNLKIDVQAPARRQCEAGRLMAV